MTSAPDLALPDLVGALRDRGVSDIDDSTLTRALYSSDASLYRVVPQVVVRPRHADELHAFIAPVLLGPRGRPGAVDWAGPDTPADAPRIKKSLVSRIINRIRGM